MGPWNNARRTDATLRRIIQLIYVGRMGCVRSVGGSTGYRSTYKTVSLNSGSCEMSKGVIMSRKHLKKGDANPPVNPDVLRIYSMRYCPFAERPLLVLAAKGIECEVVNCNLNDRPEWFLERNPAGRVPVLEYKGHVIPESLVISDLLEELFPEKPLVAKDPFQRAKDKVVLEKYGSVIGNFYKLGRNPHDAKLQEDSTKSLCSFEALFKERKSPFFGGAQFDMTDLMVWPWIQRILASDDEALNFVPELKAWADRMGGVPAVQSCRVPKEEMKTFYEGYFKDQAVYD